MTKHKCPKGICPVCETECFPDENYTGGRGQDITFEYECKECGLIFEVACLENAFNIAHRLLKVQCKGEGKK